LPGRTVYLKQLEQQRHRARVSPQQLGVQNGGVNAPAGGRGVGQLRDRLQQRLQRPADELYIVAVFTENGEENRQAYVSARQLRLRCSREEQLQLAQRAASVFRAQPAVQPLLRAHVSGRSLKKARVAPGATQRLRRPARLPRPRCRPQTGP